LRGNFKEKGILAASMKTQEELQDFADQWTRAPVCLRFAIDVAIFRRNRDFSRLKIKNSWNKEPAVLGAAYEQLLQRWERISRKQAEKFVDLLCTYQYRVAIEKFHPSSGSNLNGISVLLHLYWASHLWMRSTKKLRTTQQVPKLSVSASYSIPKVWLKPYRLTASQYSHRYSICQLMGLYSRKHPKTTPYKNAWEYPGCLGI